MAFEDHDDELITMKVEMLGRPGGPVTAFLNSVAVRDIGTDNFGFHGIPDMWIRLTRDSTGAPILLAYLKGLLDMPMQVGLREGFSIRIEP